MSQLGQQERAAVETVARRFSATWETGDGESPDAFLTIAGERIALDVAVIDQMFAKCGDLAKPRLRFDKVALRLVRDLRAVLTEAVPDGEAVALTVTAPIREPAKTAAELESRIRACLAGRPGEWELEETIHGNQTRVRIVKGVPRRASKVVGFVHNPGCDPNVLLDITQALLQHIGAAADRRSPATSATERWLVIVTRTDALPIATCRQVYSQLSIPTDFAKLLIVAPGDRIDTLMGWLA
jgi:hypothetical protein